MSQTEADEASRQECQAGDENNKLIMDIVS